MQQQFFISIDLRKIIKIPFFHSIQSHEYTAVKAEYFGRKRVSNFKSLIGLPFSQEQVIIRSVFKKFISRQKNRYIQIEAYARKQIYATKKLFFLPEQAIPIRITYDTTSPFCISTTTECFITTEIRFEMN